MFKLKFVFNSFMEKGGFTYTALGLGRRRSGLDIITDMLNASRRGINKTHLMRECNLSFPQVERYLDLTLTARLILVENNKGHRHFRTSDKGKTFLKNYEILKTLFE